MTAPYYQDDLVTLYLGDCLELGQWNRADVLLTDPPYGIGWTRGQTKRGSLQPTHHGISNDEDTTARDAMHDAWEQGVDQERPDRPWLIFGSLQAPYPFGWKRMLVFQKPEITGVMASRGPWRRDWEPIFVGGKWPDQTPMRSAVIRTTELSAGGYAGYATKAGHAHAKPLDVLTRLLEACPDGTVADPFAGSGSTLLAARMQSRKAIGVEIDERYCEAAAKRLSQQELDFGDWGGAA